MAIGSLWQKTASGRGFLSRSCRIASDPCRWLFEQEPERYAAHKDVVKRVLAGEAPANLIALVQRYFGLRYETWGKDAFGGEYPWLERPPR